MQTELTQLTKDYPKHKCPNCGNEFDLKRRNAKFCSDKCRYQFFNKNNRKAEPEQAKEPVSSTASGTQVVANLGALPPHAQYIITAQEREIKRFEDNYKEERERRKKAEEKLQELKDKIKDMEHQQTLNGIENAKPDFMDRLMGFVEKLPPPVAEAIASRLMSPGPQQLVAGTDGQLDSDVQGKVQQINTWFVGLPKGLQESVYALLVKLANAPSEADLNQTITKIQNVLNNGTGTPIVPFAAFN